MSNFSNKKKIFSVLLSLILLISSVVCYQFSASAEDSKIDEYKDKINEYEEKIDEAQDKIDSLKGDINEVKTYIQELDKQVAMYQQQIDAYQSQIDAYQSKIDVYEAEYKEYENQITVLNEKIDEYNAQIDEMNKKIDSKYDELKEIIRTNFINGESSALEVLLCSDDFSDYLTKAQFLSSVADYQQGLIDGINEEKEDVNKTIEKIDEEKINIFNLQAEIDKKIAEIEVMQSAVVENQDAVVANQNIILEKVNENSNYLSKLNSQSAGYSDKIEEYEKEIAEFEQQIEDLIKSEASTGSGTLSESSGLICPLQYSGAYVSSGFYRNSDGSYHGALDLCVSGGTYGKTVSSAEAGTVITAAYHWSYGNYIVVDHGNGLSTLYAHLSSISVSAGNSVSKGDTLGKAGSTGNSTGPHLHFEVRVNGSRVNPANYISV